MTVFSLCSELLCESASTADCLIAVLQMCLYRRLCHGVLLNTSFFTGAAPICLAMCTILIVVAADITSFLLGAYVIMLLMINAPVLYKWSYLLLL